MCDKECPPTPGPENFHAYCPIRDYPQKGYYSVTGAQLGHQRKRGVLGAPPPKSGDIPGTMRQTQRAGSIKNCWKDTSNCPPAAVLAQACLALTGSLMPGSQHSWTFINPLFVNGVACTHPHTSLKTLLGSTYPSQEQQT